MDKEKRSKKKIWKICKGLSTKIIENRSWGGKSLYLLH